MFKHMTRWSDGRMLVYQSWASSQPNNFKGSTTGQDCVNADSSWKWNDNLCTGSTTGKTVICEEYMS